MYFSAVNEQSQEQQDSFTHLSVLRMVKAPKHLRGLGVSSMSLNIYGGDKSL